MVTHHLGDITAWAFVWKQRRREVKVKLASDGPKFGTRFCEFEFNFSSTLFLDKSPRSYVPQVVLERGVQSFFQMQRLNFFPASRHTGVFGAKWRVLRLIGFANHSIILQ